MTTQRESLFRQLKNSPLLAINTPASSVSSPHSSDDHLAVLGRLVGDRGLVKF